MALIRQPLAGFPGFALFYDPMQKPFFQKNVLDDMRQIASQPIGKDLLALIAAARPAVRTVSRTANESIRTIAFSQGVNVVITPTTMTYTQSSYKMGYLPQSTVRTLQDSKHRKHNLDGCTFYPTGGCCAEPADIVAAGDGRGCVSVMKYTNAQIMTAKGERAFSFIVLAHELIHSLHHVTGTRKDTGEEQWTTGMGEFAHEPMSENAFRAAFSIPLRQRY